jgi:hypothetical protein
LRQRDPPLAELSDREIRCTAIIERDDDGDYHDLDFDDPDHRQRTDRVLERSPTF